MFEHIVQMGPLLVFAGLMAGWVAEALSRAKGYGFISDMALGVVGSVAGGGAFWRVVPTDVVGMSAMFLIGCGGAALAIVAQRRFWPSLRLET
jgi:uncharacterized membrane protein YeaQ/YmgE (transglycosylase-associated protein family)